MISRPAPATAETPSGWMARFRAVVETRLGLHFTAERARQVEAALTVVAAETGLPSAAALAEAFMDGRETPAQREALISQFTVGETYFFREMPGFVPAAERIFGERLAASLASGGGPVRVWCAGCCTGEEPYSVAIFLARLLGARAEGRVSVIGTDVNPRFLARAVRGIYRNWSFRNTPEWVVEDNPFNQKVAEKLLRRLNCDARFADSGPQALELLRTAAPDVILMDVQMPDMDGFETTARVRGLERALGRCRVPIVAVTAHAMRGDQERCLAAGMDGYVSKPFTVQSLAEALLKALEG